MRFAVQSRSAVVAAVPQDSVQERHSSPFSREVRVASASPIPCSSGSRELWDRAASNEPATLPLGRTCGRGTSQAPVPTPCDTRVRGTRTLTASRWAAPQRDRMPHSDNGSATKLHPRWIHSLSTMASPIETIVAAVVALVPLFAEGAPRCAFEQRDGTYMETVLDVGAPLPQLAEEFGSCDPTADVRAQRDRCIRIATNVRDVASRVLTTVKPMQVSREMRALKGKFETAMDAFIDAFEVYRSRSTLPDVRERWRRWRALWKAAMDELDATASRYTAQCS